MDPGRSWWRALLPVAVCLGTGAAFLLASILHL
jgi:hypothetical protein